ncbi:MAG: hypothetical protein EA374_03410 [Acholeplasmatales bacterium]|nr:MAG: hypothetical protein EA374_03410 [Acholeplasmatales bacterium]
MRIRKSVLSLLYLVFGVLILAACTPKQTTPEITEYNVLGDWVADDTDVYTLVTNTASMLEFSYDKGVYPDATLTSAPIDEDLSEFKKLVITVEGTGTMRVILKTDDPDVTKEVGLNVTGIQGSYQWNLLADTAFLAAVTEIVIIAAPEKTDSVGIIKVSEMAFYKTVADGFIIQTGFDNIPTNVNEYDGVADVFNFNAKWENFAEEVYAVTEVNGMHEVTFTKSAGEEWAALQSRVQGDFTQFNYVVVIVTGTPGQPIIVKAANDFETRVVLDGSMQEVVVNLSSMSDAQKNAIPSILIFGLAGQTGTGAFTIHEAFMIDEYAYEAPEIIKNVDPGTENTFPIVHWYDNTDGVYDIAVVEDDIVFVYEKMAPAYHWSFAIAHLEGDMSRFDKIEFDVTGQSNKSVLLKIEGPHGNVEKPVTFDGTRQTIVIDLTGLSMTARETLDKVLLFAAPGGTGSGTIILHSTTFMVSEFSLLEGWVENDLDTYDFTLIDGVLHVDYTKALGQGWVFMHNPIDPEESEGLNTLTMVLRGTPGKQLLIKPNDDGALEQWVTFEDDAPLTITVTAEAFATILIFAEPGIEDVTGSFEIIRAELTYVAPGPQDPSIDYHFESGWVDNDGGIYTFTDVDGVTVVSYEKTAGQEWAFIQNIFSENLAHHNTIEMVLKGEAGKQLIIKPNDDGAYEQVITFTGEVQTVIFTLSTPPQRVLIFVDPMEGSLSGTFEILSAKVTYVPGDIDFTHDFTDHDGGIYTFTDVDGVNVVSYEKAAGQEWAFIRHDFEGDLTRFNTITMVVQGEAGKQLLIKPNDMGIYEKVITFTGEPQTVTFTLTHTPQNVLVFVDPMAGSLSGAFEMISAVLSYVEPDVVEPVTDFTWGWEDQDGGIYTFTDDDGVTVVSYEKTAGQEWAFIKNMFIGDLSAYNTLTMIVKGEMGTQLLIKPNDLGLYEKLITFTGDPQTVTFTLDVTPSFVYIFVDPMAGSLSGAFEIHSALISYVEPDVVEPVTDFTWGWEDQDGGIYTFTDEDGVTVVSYEKTAGQEWAFIKNMFIGDLSEYNTLTMTVKGEAGVQLIIKPNDHWEYEQVVTFTGEAQTLTFTLEDTPRFIYIFVDPLEGSLSGTFEIHAASISYVPVDVDFTHGWQDQDGGIYTFTDVDGVNVITYEKAAGQAWAFIRYDFLENLTGYNTLTMVVKGEVGKQLIIKPNDMGIYEQVVDFTGEAQTLVFTMAHTPLNVLMFVDPMVGSLTGTFEIISAVASYVEPEVIEPVMDFTWGWEDQDGGIYTFTDDAGVTVVSYEKTAGQEWAFIKNTFIGDLSEFNTLTMVVKGEAGIQLIIKPNDHWAYEQVITFTGEAQTLTFTLEDTPLFIYIFVDPIEGSLSGTFEIHSALISYVEGD